MTTLLLCLMLGVRFIAPEIHNGSTVVVGWGDSNTNLVWLSAIGDIGLRIIPVHAGIGGNTVSQMIARFSTDVAPYYENGAFCVILGGLNDDVGGASVDTIYRRIQVACSLSQDAGFTTLISTYPMQGTVMYEVNDSIQAHWATFADGIIDPTADAYIGEAADHNNTTWFANIYHFSTAGYQRYAVEYVRPAIRSLI